MNANANHFAAITNISLTIDIDQEWITDTTRDDVAQYAYDETCGDYDPENYSLFTSFVNNSDGSIISFATITDDDALTIATMIRHNESHEITITVNDENSLIVNDALKATARGARNFTNLNQFMRELNRAFIMSN